MSINTLVYILLIAGMLLLESFMMEVYKKTLRKNKYSNWECRVVGAVLTAVCLALLVLSKTFVPVLNITLGSAIWFDYVIGYVLLYMAQMYTNMMIVKKLIKSICKSLVKSIGLTDEQVDIIIEAIENKSLTN